MSEVGTVDKDLSQAVVCALVNRLGGSVAIRPNEFLPDNYQVQAVRLPTGTLHLELVATVAATSADTPPQSTADSDALMHLGG